MDLGYSVKAFRKKLGLTQKELAKRAEIDQATLSRLERNRQEITVTKLTRIAHALGVKEQTLLDLAMCQGSHDQAFDDLMSRVETFWDKGERKN